MPTGRTLGFLYAAPGAGALLGTVTAGWIPRIRRQGRAVIAAVLVWGAAITCFGLLRWLPAALATGAVAAAFTPVTSVVSGGLACIAGALILARLLPAFRHQTAPATHPDPALAAAESA